MLLDDHTGLPALIGLHVVQVQVSPTAPGWQPTGPTCSPRELPAPLDALQTSLQVRWALRTSDHWDRGPIPSLHWAAAAALWSLNSG